MKAIKKIQLILALTFMGFAINACVEDDDFQTPVIEIEEPDVSVNYTLKELKDLIAKNNGEPFVIEAQATPTYVEGYIVSDDEAGNIYQKVYVQDKPENPEAGIVISTFATDVYPVRGKGRKVYIRLDGLAAASSNGMPSIGGEEDAKYGVTRMDQDKFESHVLVSPTVEKIVPTELSVNEMQNEKYLATFVKLSNVQFAQPNQNYTSNNETTNINIEDCDGNTTLLRNSSYADFADTPLPNGKGSIEGIAAVYNSDYQFFINSIEDVDFKDDRCGSEEPGNGENPGGENPDPTVVKPPFTQDFEGETSGTGQSVAIEGWTNVNVNGGSRVFEVRAFDNNNFAQVSAYKSNENPCEAWLVTPGVDLSNTTSATLSFSTKARYYKGDALTAYISTNFDGNVSAANWTELSGVTYSNGDSDNFIPSGNINLSSYAGQTVYVAFRYLGSSDNVTTTCQIDDVSITAN